MVQYSDSDVESLCEFEGDELESNLEMLKATFAADGDVFEALIAKRTATDWKKVERRRMGYNGQSVRRQQELAKKAKEDAATRETKERTGPIRV